MAISYAISGTHNRQRLHRAEWGNYHPCHTLTDTIVLASIAENLVEGDETVILTLLSTNNDRVTIDPDPADQTATVTIVDDDLATVSVAASAPTTTEGSGTPGVFNLSLDKPTQAGVTVTYSISGTAASGIDYNALSGSAYIEPLTTYSVCRFVSIEDILLKADESVSLTISSTDHPRVSVATGEDKTATVTINDMTPPKSALLLHKARLPKTGRGRLRMVNIPFP